MKFRRKKQAGFTLLELIIVIAIIAILSVVAMVNLTIAKAKARDASRINILSQLITGMEAYYTYNGMYPCGDANEWEPGVNPMDGTTDNSGSGGACDGGGSPSDDTAGFLNGCATPTDPNCSSVTNCTSAPYGGLLTELIATTNCPQDPQGPADIGGVRYRFDYHVTGDRQTYVIFSYLETAPNAMANDGGRCTNLYETGNGVGSLLPWRDGVGTSSDGCTPL